MEKHPIQGIMSTTMENIRDMVDVNTVIGDPVTTPDGSTIIPISRVTFGFVAGGGEYTVGTKAQQERQADDLPFAGGAGAGVSVQPLGFLSVNPVQIKLLPAQYYAPIDRVIELIPQVFGEVKKLVDSACASKQETPQP